MINDNSDWVLRGCSWDWPDASHFNVPYGGVGLSSADTRFCRRTDHSFRLARLISPLRQLANVQEEKE